MNKFISTAIIVLILPLMGFVLVKYWSFIFADKVYGELLDVERVEASSAALLGNFKDGRSEDKLFFSFAVALKTAEGEIYTSSSEDRQWAVAKKGLCAEVKFFPYPPWEIDKMGTYFNARLLKLIECDHKSATEQKEVGPTNLPESAAEPINESNQKAQDSSLHL